MGKMETSRQIGMEANNSYLNEIVSKYQAMELAISKQMIAMDGLTQQLQVLVGQAHKTLADLDQMSESVARTWRNTSKNEPKAATQPHWTWKLSIMAVWSVGIAAVGALVIALTLPPPVAVDEQRLAQMVAERLTPALDAALAPYTTTQRGATPTTARPNMPRHGQAPH